MITSDSSKVGLRSYQDIPEEDCRPVLGKDVFECADCGTMMGDPYDMWEECVDDFVAVCKTCEVHRSEEEGE